MHIQRLMDIWDDIYNAATECQKVKYREMQSLTVLNGQHNIFKFGKHFVLTENNTRHKFSGGISVNWHWTVQHKCERRCTTQRQWHMNEDVTGRLRELTVSEGNKPGTLHKSKAKKKCISGSDWQETATVSTEWVTIKRSNNWCLLSLTEIIK